MKSFKNFMEALFVVLMGLMVIGIILYFIGFFFGAGFNTSAHFVELTAMTKVIL